MKLSDVKPLFESKENDAKTLEVLNGLEFLETTKKKIVYTKQDVVTAETYMKMPRLTFAEAAEDFLLDGTVTADGTREPPSKVEKGGIVFSGPSAEKYYPTQNKLKKNWVFDGDNAYPEQNIRLVAQWKNKSDLAFWPSYETTEKMVAKPGDYIVKEGEGKFYRVGKAEYEQTYNQPGRKG